MYINTRRRAVTIMAAYSTELLRYVTNEVGSRITTVVVVVVCVDVLVGIHDPRGRPHRHRERGLFDIRVSNFFSDVHQ